MDFQDKVVIVTGSSSGIGAAVALRFAELGARVVVTGRDQPRLAEVAARCQRAGRFTPLIVTADITVDADLQILVHQTIQAFGRIDVLVNNAGTSIRAGVQDGIAAFDRVLATNLRSVYLLTSLAIPYLIKSKGSIVNISSINGMKPGTTSTPYCVSKAGLDMLTKSAAKDLARYGVNVNSVNPGVVQTNLQHAIGMSDEEINIFIKDRLQKYPLGRFPTCEDVSHLVTFLASDHAASITGATHVIDCGTLLM